MPSSSLPLLRLPFLALREVMKKIGLKELFAFSLCSNKMYYVAKNFRDKSIEPTLTLQEYIDIYISIRCKTDHLILTVNSLTGDFLKEWKTNRIGKEIARIQQYKTSFRTYWQNEVHGTEALLKYTIDLFGMKVELLWLDGARVWIMDFVEKLLGPGSYKVKVRNATDIQLKHILVDLNPKSLTIDQTSSNMFRIYNFNKKYDEFKLSKGEWITVNNLCTLDCIKLQVVDKKFSSTEINQYFNHVMAGGAPRLKVFRCRVLYASSNTILAKIRESLTAVPGKEQFTWDQGNWKFVGRLDRGEDSVLVTINYFCLSKHILLSISEKSSMID